MTAINESGTLVRNVRTPEGADLGRHMARLCDVAEPIARLKEPLIPPRCASCALRAGNHHPNGSPATLWAVLDCLDTGQEFSCHEPARDGQPCSGWMFFFLAYNEKDSPCA